MANTSPVNDHREITGYMLEQSRAAHSSRLVPVSAVSKRLEGIELVDYARMAEAGARLFSDDGMPVDDQDFLVEALRRVGQLGFAISLHEEDRHLSAENTMNSGVVATRLGLQGIPAAAESLRVRRDLELALTSGCALHLAHVSAAESVEIIKAS